jgi:hypothetical protein
MHASLPGCISAHRSTHPSHWIMRALQVDEKMIPLF